MELVPMIPHVLFELKRPDFYYPDSRVLGDNFAIMITIVIAILIVVVLITDCFLLYRFGGLIFGGAYTWRGLFSEFYGIYLPKNV